MGDEPDYAAEASGAFGVSVEHRRVVEGEECMPWLGKGKCAEPPAKISSGGLGEAASPQMHMTKERAEPDPGDWPGRAKNRKTEATGELSSRFKREKPCVQSLLQLCDPHAGLGALRVE